MEKVLMIAIAIFLTGSISAQESGELVNKNGVEILPKAGEFAIGMDAAPFLRYVGDIFGFSGSNNAITGNKFLSDYYSSNTVYGKYMLSDQTALRANFRLTDQKYTYKYNVYNDAVNSPDSLVEDRMIDEYSEFNIGLGYEFRRGKTRLQGIYGGEVVFMRMQSKANYEYGNNFGTSNMTPTSMYDVNGALQGGNGANVAERIASMEGSRFFGVGLRAFVGVEYYFTPKICLGSEFGQALSYTANKASTLTTEFFDPTGSDESGNVGVVRQNQTIIAGQKYFGLNTDNFNGSLYLLFFF